MWVIFFSTNYYVDTYFETQIQGYTALSEWCENLMCIQIINIGTKFIRDTQIY